MMVYILPIVLFVITLVIILALRAEDKKSRSLQTVKEKIISFRNESTQTINRIQETCHDCTDKIDAKKSETDNIVAQIDASLETLSGKKRDLVELESICKSYELALEKLKVQTEHVVSRVTVVQNAVAEAELINKGIDKFKVDAQNIEENLLAIENSYKKLVDNTNEALDQVAADHEAKHKELLNDFNGELASSREELGLFIDEVRAQFEAKESEFNKAASEMVSTIENGRTEYDDKCAAGLSSLDDRYTALKDQLDEQEKSIQDSRSSLGAYFDSRQQEASEDTDKLLAEIEAQKGELKTLCETLLANLNSAEQASISAISEKSEEQKVQFASLEEQLGKAEEGMNEEVEALRQKLSADVDSVLNEKKEMESALDAEKVAITALTAKNREILDAAMKSAQETIDQALAAVLEQISATREETERLLGETVSSSVSELEKAKGESEEYREKLVSELRAEEEAYVEKCRTRLREIMTEEANRIDGIFQAMSNATSESISNLAKRQTEIKETVSLLNQGSTETIANAVERLQSLQSRLSASQASFDEVQRRVADVKQELLKLNEQKNSIAAEVTRMNNEMETEQEKINSLKQERRDAEGQIARLRIEKDSLSKSRQKPDSDSFDFDGDEEQIPLDDDN